MCGPNHILFIFIFSQYFPFFLLFFLSIYLSELSNSILFYSNVTFPFLCYFTCTYMSYVFISFANLILFFLLSGEKLMKAVFNLARTLQPSVIFFDEIDALMSARKVICF